MTILFTPPSAALPTPILYLLFAVLFWSLLMPSSCPSCFHPMWYTCVCYLPKPLIVLSCVPSPKCLNSPSLLWSLLVLCILCLCFCLVSLYFILFLALLCQAIFRSFFSNKPFVASKLHLGSTPCDSSESNLISALHISTDYNTLSLGCRSFQVRQMNNSIKQNT